MNKIVVKLYQGTKIILKTITFNLFVRPFLLRKPSYGKEYAISICAIFKNEGRFLKEWIEYHLLVGVDHFFLYNNESTDNYLEVLQPYIDKQIVTLIEYPGQCMQLKAYEDFYDRYAKRTQWVSFLDIDEFICPNSCLSIKEWIKSYERFPVVLIYWKMFGTSGQMTHDNEKLVIEQYHVCWKTIYHVGKCFVNTDYAIANCDKVWFHEPEVYYPLFGFRIRVYPVNQFKRVSINELSRNIESINRDTPIQINHYWSKAWDVYDAKRQLTDVMKKNNPKKNISYFLSHEHKNSDTDYNIYKFLMELKLKMRGIQ